MWTKPNCQLCRQQNLQNTTERILLANFLPNIKHALLKVCLWTCQYTGVTANVQTLSSSLVNCCATVGDPFIKERSGLTGSMHQGPITIRWKEWASFINVLCKSGLRTQIFCWWMPITHKLPSTNSCKHNRSGKNNSGKHYFKSLRRSFSRVSWLHKWTHKQRNSNLLAIIFIGPQCVCKKSCQFKYLFVLSENFLKSCTKLRIFDHKNYKTLHGTLNGPRWAS